MPVHLGKHYRPQRFERRTSDGTFESFNMPLGSNAERLQTALLSSPRIPTRVLQWFQWLLRG